jgi:hypothetical protein
MRTSEASSGPGHKTEYLHIGKAHNTPLNTNASSTAQSPFHFTLTHKPLCYKSKQYNETLKQFIKNTIKLGPLLQTDSKITQMFSLTKSVISEISDNVFAQVIF